MASYVLPPRGGLHKTLSGTTADTIDVDTDFPVPREVEILNHSDSAGPIYFRNDGQVAVSAADGTTIIEVGQYYTVELYEGHPVSIVGSGQTYSVDHA